MISTRVNPRLGDEHEKTKESGECLRHLTQQAVVLQKKMNDIYQGKSKTGLPPIQIQPPSMGSVLDMLNIINGILFVQISQRDIENFKKEYDIRQQNKSETDKSEASGKADLKEIDTDNKEVEAAESKTEASVTAPVAAPAVMEDIPVS